MNRLLRVVWALTAIFACLIVLGGIARAQADESLKTATSQADGIVDRVVDDLWLHTDYHWHHGDYNRIIALIRVCVSADPTFVEAYGDGAWLMWSMGDDAAANAFLDDGMRNSPARAEIADEYGAHLYLTKHFADAAKYLKEAIAFGAESRLTYAMLGHSYRQEKKYDDAIATWKLIVQRFPDYAAAKTNLNRVIELKKKAEKSSGATPSGAPAAGG